MVHALYVTNKLLPTNDHRILFPQVSEICTVTFAMPDIKDGEKPELFKKVGFGEGIGFRDIPHYLKLLIYLLRNSESFNFVHFYSTGLILIGPFLARLAGLPSLITITGFGRTFTSQHRLYRHLRQVYRFLLSQSIHISRGVLFQNWTDHAIVSRWFPGEKEKFYYVGSAVSLPIIKSKSFNPPRLKVLLVARLFPEKGIQDFLSVAKHLSNDGFEFILVGPVSVGFENLLEQVLEYERRGLLTYTGELDSAAIQDQYTQAQIFYFPSTYGEGMSRVMLEAGYAKLCPIAYDIPANCDLIQEGRGFLVPQRDIEKVIQILTELSKNRLILEQNARAYQEYIINNYNIQVYACRMDNILRELGLA